MFIRSYYFWLVSLFTHLVLSSHEISRRGLVSCVSIPPSFCRRWQVIGQKGRQIWINKHYLQIVGPVDDIFGKAAGGLRVHWYNLKCDDDMIQFKATITESKSHDRGEYMCMRLKREHSDVLGFVVRQITKVSQKYNIDCEYWGDGSTRHAFKFHVTDTPTWVDLLHSGDAFKRAGTTMEMKVCGEIPEGFHGDWKLGSTNKIVQFKNKYYRAFGAHGNDPFWRTNTEIRFYSLLCNIRRILLKTYLWELPINSKSQLQCLSLNLVGEYDLKGHAVNMVSSKLQGDNPPEIDCEHKIGKSYTRYPLHLTRELDKALDAKNIHNQVDYNEIINQESLEPQVHDSKEYYYTADYLHTDNNSPHDTDSHLLHHKADNPQHHTANYPQHHTANYPRHHTANYPRHHTANYPRHHTADHSDYFDENSLLTENHRISDQNNDNKVNGKFDLETTSMDMYQNHKILPLRESSWSHHNSEQTMEHPTLHSYPTGGHDAISPPLINSNFVRHHANLRRRRPQFHMWRPWIDGSLYQPVQYSYPYASIPSYNWFGKRSMIQKRLENDIKNTNSTLNSDKCRGGDYIQSYSDDYYDNMEEENLERQLVSAVKQQNTLLKKTYNKISSFIDNVLTSTTEDWNQIPPYHQHKSEDKRDEIFYYLGDD